METWILYAFLSAIFAGMTSILAKFGMNQLSADQALAIRVLTICFIVLAVAAIQHRGDTFKGLAIRDSALLIASGITTSLSWIFYPRIVIRQVPNDNSP